MTAAPNEPDWLALPDDPCRFFGLPADFDRIELRRKYSALIRRFKPEKHPHEFQRIRAAFEDLDQQLRGSQRQTQHPRPVSSFHSPSDADRSNAQQPLEPTDSKPPERPTRRTIETRRSETPEQLTQSLRGLAHRLRNDHFYAEAWPLWEELTAVEPFERWRPLFAELSEVVDSNNFDEPPVEKVEFMIHFLRRALWIASDDWLDDAFEFLDNNADLVREPWDYEFLLRLDDYRDDREGFLNGTHARQVIDHAIRDWCMLTLDEAAQVFRRYQAELAAHPEWLREAFPIGDADMTMHWGLWDWISKDACSRLWPADRATAATKVSLQQLFEQAAALIQRSIEFAAWERIDSTRDFMRNLGNAMAATVIGFFAFCVGVGVMLLVLPRESPEFMAIILPAAVGLFVFAQAFRRGRAVLLTDGPSWTASDNDRERDRQLAQTCYEHHLIPLFEALVLQTGIAFDDLVELSRQELESTASTLRKGLPFVRWIHHLMATDYALACLATAQPFLR